MHMEGYKAGFTHKKANTLIRNQFSSSAQFHAESVYKKQHFQTYGNVKKKKRFEKNYM